MNNTTLKDYCKARDILKDTCTDCKFTSLCDDSYFEDNQNKIVDVLLGGGLVKEEIVNNHRFENSMKTQLILSNEAKQIMLKLNIKKIKLAIALNISRRNLDRFLNCEADCRMSTVNKIMNYLYAMEEVE